MQSRRSGTSASASSSPLGHLHSINGFRHPRVSASTCLSWYSGNIGVGACQQITGKVVIAIQIVGEGEAGHPRVCWHCHKQEVLVVGFGKRVLRIDTTKVVKGEPPFADEPLKCPVEKLIDGVQFVGKHDGEVTFR